MKTIRKEIEISAPREKVWTVLVEKTYNRDWMSAFSEGTKVSTDWIEGHKVTFTDNSNNGLVGKITAKQPYELLRITYEGEVKNGIEEYESDMAKELKGAEELYELSTQDGNTILKISSDMHEAHFEQMSAAWEVALQRISELSHAV